MSESRAGPVPPSVRAAAFDLRVLRALPFATVCVVLSAAGHVLASAERIPPGAILLGWVLVTGFAVLGARRERSTRAIVGGLAGGQAGLHLLFHAAQAEHRAPVPGGTTVMAGMAGMPGMDGRSGSGAAMTTHIAAGAGASHHTAVAATHLGLWCHAALGGLSPAMLLAHLAATLAAGWWLRRGEAAVWALVRLASRTAEAAGRVCADQLRGVLALFAALRDGLHAPGDAVRRAAGTGRSGRACSALLRHVVIRRGPPRHATA